MIIEKDNKLNSPVRHINGRVELIVGSTPTPENMIFTGDDHLQSIKIIQSGAKNDFYGYGIGQTAEIKLVDRDREIDIQENQPIKISLTSNTEYVSTFPIFYVESVTRNEVTNVITLTTSDKVSQTNSRKMKEINLEYPYSLQTIVDKCARKLGLTVSFDKAIPAQLYQMQFTNGVNANTEVTFRQIFDDAAAFTQSIWFIEDNKIIFKRFKKDIDYNLTKDYYIQLDTKESIKLTTIVSTNEYGNAIGASTGEDGASQVFKDNVFYTALPDSTTATLLGDAITVVGGLILTQFKVKWRGNYLLQLGDTLAVEDKKDLPVVVYHRNNTITFNGGLIEESNWGIDSTIRVDKETGNSSALGTVLNDTVVKVNKATGEISELITKTDGHSSQINELNKNASGIQGSIKDIKTQTNSMNNTITELENELALKADAASLDFTIKETVKGLESGGVKVEGKNYKFDKTGMTISAVEDETKGFLTKIDENGMQVFDNGKAQLVANADGVDAVDLHASTYLKIGKNCRFEDYGSNRTGCFWTGGNN